MDNSPIGAEALRAENTQSVRASGSVHVGQYEPPVLVRLGSVHELTLGAPFCDKMYGSSDGYTMGGSPITCTSV